MADQPSPLVAARSTDSSSPVPLDISLASVSLLDTATPAMSPIAPASAAATIAPAFRLRSLMWSAYLPTLLLAIGQGAVNPYYALLVAERGASLWLASLIVSLRGISTMCFDIPAGAVVSKLGERAGMLLAGLVAIVVAIGIMLARSALAMAVLLFVSGFATALQQIGRQTYIAEHCPLTSRGRVMSLIAGCVRMGSFVGPFLAAGVVARTSLAVVFAIQAAFAPAASVVVFITVPRNDGETDSSGKRGAHAHHTCAATLAIVRENAFVLRTAGTTSMSLFLLRSAQQTLLPLWARHIVGLSNTAVGNVIGAASAVDAAVFYPAGVVMDRLGRKAVAAPSLAFLAVGLLVLPFARTLVSFTTLAMLIGFGNGLGAGVVMTMGADLAPPGQRARFLGVWRMFGDFGTSAGPAVLGLVTRAASLASASLSVGALGLAGLVITLLCVPETLTYRRHNEAAEAARMEPAAELTPVQLPSGVAHS